MLGFLLIAFPFVLLGFVILMGRVEEPMNQVADQQHIEQFLETANDGELTTFVLEGAEPALRRRRRLLGLRRRKRSSREAGA